MPSTRIMHSKLRRALSAVYHACQADSSLLSARGSFMYKCALHLGQSSSRVGGIVGRFCLASRIRARRMATKVWKAARSSVKLDDSTFRRMSCDNALFKKAELSKDGGSTCAWARWDVKPRPVRST